MVRISACHVEGPGSIPGRGDTFFLSENGAIPAQHGYHGLWRISSETRRVHNTPKYTSFSHPTWIYWSYCTCFGSTYTKIGTIQRRLAWPLRKDDTQNREAFHIFWHRICHCYVILKIINVTKHQLMLKLTNILRVDWKMRGERHRFGFESRRGNEKRRHDDGGETDKIKRL